MSGYLSLLDELLATGMTSTTADFRRTQEHFVLSNQLPDGGFRGRGQTTDLYYTDFALRLLYLLPYDGAAWAGAAEYLQSLPLPAQELGYDHWLFSCRKRGV